VHNARFFDGGYGMKNVYLMGLFALLMTVAFSGQSVSAVSFVSPAYASDDDGNDDSSKDESDSDSDSDSSDDDSDKDGSDDASNNDDSDSGVAFSCPEGVSTCYRADGTEYIDVNNLTAAAAGDDEDSLVKVVNPRHYRSF